jgi:TruD family tRNA pseudouridine synthase
MTSPSENLLWGAEQSYLVQERLRHPELFFVPQRHATERLEYIGITHDTAQLPLGFVKFSPFDFIVEEILPDGTVAAVEESPAPKAPAPQSKIVYAALVKAGLLSSVDAIQKLSEVLGTNIANIRHAGVKDANALTGQRISIAGVPAQKLSGLKLPGMFLQNIAAAQEHVRVGQLHGNRFTVVVRTARPVDQMHMQSAVQRLGAEGFLNFYGEQRFGMPRLHTMHCGRLLLAGKLNEALRMFLVESTPFEQPFVQRLRTQAGECYGDWKAMHQLFARLPYTLRNEVSILNVLMQNTTATAADAFTAVPTCVRYWAMAYGSYLTNILLSRNINLPEKLGLLLNKNPDGDSVYAEFLERDGTAGYHQQAARYSFIPLSDNPTIPTRIFPVVHGVHVGQDAVTLSFDLPKGAYATTMLYHVFDLQSVPGIPQWISRNDIDGKAALGTSNLSRVFQRFGTARDETIQRNIFFTRES